MTIFNFNNCFLIELYRQTKHNTMGWGHKGRCNSNNHLITGTYMMVHRSVTLCHLIGPLEVLMTNTCMSLIKMDCKKIK